MGLLRTFARGCSTGRRAELAGASKAPSSPRWSGKACLLTPGRRILPASAQSAWRSESRRHPLGRRVLAEQRSGGAYLAPDHLAAVVLDVDAPVLAEVLHEEKPAMGVGESTWGGVGLAVLSSRASMRMRSSRWATVSSTGLWACRTALVTSSVATSCARNRVSSPTDSRRNSSSTKHRASWALARSGAKRRVATLRPYPTTYGGNPPERRGCCWSQRSTQLTASGPRRASRTCVASGLTWKDVFSWRCSGRRERMDVWLPLLPRHLQVLREVPQDG